MAKKPKSRALQAPPRTAPRASRAPAPHAPVAAAPSAPPAEPVAGLGDAPAQAAAPAESQPAPAPAPASPLPAVVEREWREKMEFALGMAVNTLHFMRSSGLLPTMAVQAMLRAAGMGIEAYALGGNLSASEEVLLGREKQAQFQAQAAKAAGQQPA